MDTLIPRDQRDAIEIVTAAVANAAPLEVSGAATKTGLGRSRHCAGAGQHRRNERRFAL